MRRFIVHGFLLAAAWMLIRGSISFPALITGLVLGTSIAFMFRRFHPGDFQASSILRTPYLAFYTASFVKELAISNLDVAYRVLHPSMPLNPQVIKYRTDLSHPTAVTILANSITLTPGTLVVDYREKSQKLVIHCLSMENRHEVVEGIDRWEKMLSKVFGESS